MDNKEYNKLYATSILAILVIVSLFAIINKYSLKYAIIMSSSWIAFILYNKILSDLMRKNKISKYSWMILWLVGWMLTIIICRITKGV